MPEMIDQARAVLRSQELDEVGFLEYPASTDDVEGACSHAAANRGLLVALLKEHEKALGMKKRQGWWWLAVEGAQAALHAFVRENQ